MHRKRKRITKFTKRSKRIEAFKLFMHRFTLRFSLSLVVLWLGAWAVLSGGVSHLGQLSYNAAMGASASMGWRLENIYVEGRENADADLLKAQINAEKHMPLLALDLPAIHKSVSAISWVEAVSVERVFPNSLYITLQERSPIALWRDKGSRHLIDSNGAVISTQDLQRFEGLITLRGPQAPRKAGELFAHLSAVPEIAERVDQAILISGRRWDLQMKSKLQVKLPEKDVFLALQRLQAAQNDNEILDKTIKHIDIRQPDRLIIKAYPGAAQEYQPVSGKGKRI